MLTATCNAHPLGAPDGLTCTRTAHDDGGHIFESAWLADRRTEEVGDE